MSAMDSPKAPEGEAERKYEYHPNMENNGRDMLDVLCPTHTTEKRIVQRIDWHIVPFVCIMYLLAFLDRVNIANAKSFRLVEDLHLVENEYNTALTKYDKQTLAFALVVSTNVLSTLPTCMLGFGIASIGQGLVQNYSGLLATRFFLGLFETGMFPGCFYLLGMWYQRSEAQKRFSLFFSSTSLAGAFGGLLASAIGKMQGMHGDSGWRWIFIVEGTLTAVVAIIFYFTFPSFPEDATWLKENEREYVKARLRVDQGSSAAERKVTIHDVFQVLRDHRVWLGALMYFGMIVPAYGYAFFAPTILSTYHYDAIHTQLYSVPPWAVSFGFSLLIAYFSDSFRHRFAFAVGPLALSITGFGILLGVHSKTHLEYAALFLVVMGTYGAMPIIICWFNMNLSGHHRRSIGVAWQIGFGNIGGIIATYAFLSRDSPYFIKGYAICIAFTILSGLASLCYFASITIENRRRRRVLDTDPGPRQLSQDEKTELGDLNLEFRYMY